MTKLLDLWIAQGQKAGLKVRYQDWSKVKYFEIESIDETGRFIVGTLDTGEIARYPIANYHFELYREGGEYIAQAV